jgi:threonine dehydrogenase-like Zn-dependent dehydrogenase
MGDKTIQTNLCPGGKERMQRLLRLIEMGRIDPTPMTTHTFAFEQIEWAFAIMSSKEKNVIKPLTTFD